MSCLMGTIREMDSECQKLLDEMAGATTLSLMIMYAWQLARTLAVRLVEETLANRAQSPTEWEACEKCGKRLQSKGFAPRQIKSIIGLIKWERRLGRCSNKCALGQVAPLDDDLGLTSHQKSDLGLQRIACLAAIFMPFETAEMLLSQLSGVSVSSQTIWEWVQATGRQMMDSLEAELTALKHGVEPEIEVIKAEVAAETLLIGADGVMVPFRPQEKTAQGKTKWQEVKVAILVRLGQGFTRAGKAITRLHRHRVTAVLGDIDELSDRMWLESLKQGLKQAPQVSG